MTLKNVSGILGGDLSSLKVASTQVESNQAAALMRLLACLTDVCQILEQVNAEAGTLGGMVVTLERKVVKLEDWMAARKADLEAQKAERFREGAGFRKAA